MYDGSEAFCLKTVWHNSWIVILIPTEYSAPPCLRSIFYQQRLPHGDYTSLFILVFQFGPQLNVLYDYYELSSWLTHQLAQI